MTKRKVKAKGIYLDNNGTYYLKFRNKTYRGFETVAAADRKKSQLLLSPDTKDKMLFQSLIDDYLNTLYIKYKTDEITYGTYNKRSTTISHYIMNHFSKFRFNNLSALEMRNYRNSLVDLELSSSHKNYILTTLKHILKHGVLYHQLNADYSIYLENFPTTKNELKKRKQRFDYIWDNEDFYKFLSFVDDVNFKLCYTLFFKHGLRIGEAQGLLWNNVDFDSKTITIEASITKKTESKGIERKETKTSASERTIYVGNTIDMFAELYKEKSTVYKFNNKRYVLGSSAPLSSRRIDRVRMNAIEKSSLPYITNHDMRHFFVTNSWSKVPLTALSSYIGHKDVSVTLKEYSHLSQEDASKIYDFIDSNTK